MKTQSDKKRVGLAGDSPHWAAQVNNLESATNAKCEPVVYLHGWKERGFVRHRRSICRGCGAGGTVAAIKMLLGQSQSRKAQSRLLVHERLLAVMQGAGTGASGRGEEFQ